MTNPSPLIQASIRPACQCGRGRRHTLRTLGGAAGWLAFAGSAVSLAACSREQAAQVVQGPAEITRETACALDGMLLADYPGPKGQILYAGARQPDFYCDTVEVLATLKTPEQVRAVAGAWVQDMAKANWDEPQGHWIDARTAWYVGGSRRRGSMGPTFASFASEDAARTFAAEHGGKVVAFAAVSADMVDLRGGAKSDTRM